MIPEADAVTLVHFRYKSFGLNDFSLLLHFFGAVLLKAQQKKLEKQAITENVASIIQGRLL